jgi:hypothetical protein
MNRNAYAFSFLAPAMAALVGCSSGPADSAAKKAVVWDKIQGKAQVIEEPGGTENAALNAGGSSIYIWKGVRRYRLFLRKPVEVEHGKQYVVEGLLAQRVIDEIGDPDGGKHGYPLQTSCAEVIHRAWPGIALDDADLDTSVLRSAVQRYPARGVFLVNKIDPAPASTGGDEPNDADDTKIPDVKVPAEKQRSSLTSTPPVLTTPLWSPDGGKVSCAVIINSKGEVSELKTGKQLCEAVPWDAYHYTPPVQGGKPVKVDTEVEVSFDARK